MDFQKPRAALILFFGILIGITSAVAVAMGVWGADHRAVQSFVGLTGVGAGLFLLTSKRLFVRNPATPATPAASALQHLARKRLRLVGVTGILMGASVMFTDDVIRLTLLICAAVVSVGSALRLPRRVFAPPADAA